ncbi:hypothetical protein CC85DRAFT_281612 [Cutaneotrichosporon oleaginosum]|uniref:Uncharacterized protein n=1 Tax=Cutaneotrichosporon oleaginosum TaxID=879819 RepID=A0A0J0XZN5_9TREE|nr:uncharacterized protein CC85DRAFT_281612 [Cutaneotrichosporon oleaginosum]KLT46505.1 hypothetical protein CC85DRAFT_281612 [Cutaneotrichosporon oleaginosum]TXT15128.1 hypothetical protein COLE_01321 [Cutaneotrichosporon oleaginosum]
MALPVLLFSCCLELTISQESNAYGPHPAKVSSLPRNRGSLPLAYYSVTPHLSSKPTRSYEQRGQTVHVSLPTPDPQGGLQLDLSG